MTRKQALSEAINALAGYDKYKTVVSCLKDILEEWPLNHWTDGAIRDAVDQFILDNNRPPVTRDFNRRGMPSRPTFERKYKMTAKEWMSIHYPHPKTSYEELKIAQTQNFINEYNRIKPVTFTEYENKKKTGLVLWRTVARYNDVTSWQDLIEILNLENFSCVKKDFSVNILNDYTFED